MKVFVHSLFAAVLLVGSLFAQEAAIPLLPEGPLLKRTPTFSTWTVTVENSGGVGEPAIGFEAGDESSGQKTPTGVRHSKVVKTGPTIVEIRSDRLGNRTEMWHYRGIRVAKLHDASEPMIFTGGGRANDIYSIDFAKSDFAGLDWIAADRYAGMAKYNGRPCLVFKGSVSPLNSRAKFEQASAVQNAVADGRTPPEIVEVPAAVYVDLDSRLPLLATFGVERRTYHYGPAPTKPLELPAELANAVKEYVRKVERLSAPAARPY